MWNPNVSCEIEWQNLFEWDIQEESNVSIQVWKWGSPDAGTTLRPLSRKPNRPRDIVTPIFETCFAFPCFRAFLLPKVIFAAEYSTAVGGWTLRHMILRLDTSGFGQVLNTAFLVNITWPEKLASRALASSMVATALGLHQTQLDSRVSLKVH